MGTEDGRFETSSNDSFTNISFRIEGHLNINNLKVTEYILITFKHKQYHNKSLQILDSQMVSFFNTCISYENIP